MYIVCSFFVVLPWGQRERFTALFYGLAELIKTSALLGPLGSIVEILY